MTGYWVRHRLLLSVIVCAAVALITSLLFTYPSIVRRANAYNAQSIYRNTETDFIAPEPSFEQITDLPGSYGIEKVFPFFLTKSSVKVGGSSRTTTILLSDQFQNIDITMYNANRLISKSDEQYDNPILVDWQFCHDTSSQIGDTISLSIGGNNIDYRIYAIYETNTIYDGGAILAEISDAQKNAIAEQSNNNGYSGMYIKADDVNECRSYLSTEYRPLGRLKSRDQFSDDKQYQLHYDAIMSSGYANEITDFRVRETNSEQGESSIMVWLGAILAAVILIGFNLIMAKRGCEKVYFTKHCIPKGQNVRPYYTTSVFFETIVAIALYAVFLILAIRQSDTFIPKSTISIMVAVAPAAVLVAEIVSFIMNNSMVAGITKKIELEKRRS